MQEKTQQSKFWSFSSNSVPLVVMIMGTGLGSFYLLYTHLTDLSKVISSHFASDSSMLNLYLEYISNSKIFFLAVCSFLFLISNLSFLSLYLLRQARSWQKVELQLEKLEKGIYSQPFTHLGVDVPKNLTKSLESLRIMMARQQGINQHLLAMSIPHTSLSISKKVLGRTLMKKKQKIVLIICQMIVLLSLLAHYIPKPEYSEPEKKKKIIKREKQRKVIVYSKKYCPYCLQAKALLDDLNVSYHEIDISRSPEFYDEMVQKSEGRKTVPQILIDDIPIGGFNSLNNLYEKKELESLFLLHNFKNQLLIIVFI